MVIDFMRTAAKSVVMEFYKDDVVAIENTQKLINDTNLELDIINIKANYENLPKYIIILETFRLSLAH